MDDQKQYTLEELKDEITEKNKIFAHNYIIDWNATRSYKKAYGIEDDNVAAVSGCNLLRNPKVKQYIDLIKNNLEEEAGVSKLRVLNEFTKIAFSSIAHLHNTWIDRKDFESLTDDQKASIESIDTKTVTINFNEETKEVEYVKIKLYSKLQANIEIKKMLGYDLSVRTDLTTLGEKITSPFLELMKRASQSHNE